MIGMNFQEQITSEDEEVEEEVVVSIADEDTIDDEDHLEDTEVETEDEDQMDSSIEEEEVVDHQVEVDIVTLMEGLAMEAETVDILAEEIAHIPTIDIKVDQTVQISEQTQDTPHLAQEEVATIDSIYNSPSF